MMQKYGKFKVAALCLVALGLIFGYQCVTGSQKDLAADQNEYVGAARCKMCHSGEAKGNVYQIWEKSKHHQAWVTLGEAEAKKIGAEKKIADPQTDKACEPCHVTAYDAPKAEVGKKFDIKMGVQCETCHGAGGNHVKARLADEGPVKPDEIVHVPSATVCEGCHNNKSPTFKAFNYVEFVKKIEHVDPRIKHPANWIDTLGEKK